MNTHPQEGQSFIPEATETDVFIAIQAPTRAEAERIYGAVFDQPEAEIHHD